MRHARAAARLAAPDPRQVAPKRTTSAPMAQHPAGSAQARRAKVRSQLIC